MNLGIIIHLSISRNRAPHALYKFTPVCSSKNIIANKQLQQTHLESRFVKGAFPTFWDQPCSEARRLYFKIIFQRVVCWPESPEPTWELVRNAKSYPRPTVLWVCCMIWELLRILNFGMKVKKLIRSDNIWSSHKLVAYERGNTQRPD